MAKRIIKLNNKDANTTVNGSMSNLPIYDEVGDIRLMSEKQRLTLTEVLERFTLKTSSELIDKIKKAIKDESKIMLDKNK